MDTIDIRGLPEPVARAIAETVENLKRQYCRKEGKTRVELPTRPLGVIGPLDRKTIYDDHLDRKL